MTSGQKMIQFHKLCELQPRLRELYEEAKAIKDDPSTPAFCANAVWYGFGSWTDRGFKARLSRLVGYTAGLKKSLPNPFPEAIPNEQEGARRSFEDGLVRASDLSRIAAEGPAPDPDFPEDLRCESAVQVCTKIIYGALPPCRNCNCF